MINDASKGSLAMIKLKEEARKRLKDSLKASLNANNSELVVN